MARADVLHPDRSDLEKFLYAFVGADREGFEVTVLSTLARLGLDPWKEAAELADMSEESAGARLGVLLGKFGDVPAVTAGNESIARKLIALLPSRTKRPLRSKAGTSQSTARMGSVVSIAAIAVVLIVLARLLIPGV